MSQAMPDLLRGAEPQFYRGNEIGCLVIHGFMASPAEVGWLGKHLADQGYTVYVPRLTGHGINPRHMRRMRWEDWYGQVLDGYHLLKQQCEKVYVIGHSMGGLLSLLLASEKNVDGLVVVATPFSIDYALAPVTILIDLMMPYTEHPSEPELNAVIIAEQEKRGETVTSRVHYPKWSTRAVHEFYRLMTYTRKMVGKVSTPVLLLYAEHDETAPPAQMDWLAKHIKSKHIEKATLHQGGHIIFQDAARDEAFETVARFIRSM